MYNIHVKPKAILAAILALLLMALPMGGVACAESLWSDSGQGANLFSDHRARAVGDILTIVINENSTASRVGTANNSKSGSLKVDAGTGLFTFVDGITAGHSDSFKADGKISNSNNVSAKLTVIVNAIKPNGNLVISGTQMIKQNGEEQKILISGEVRPEDINVDNTVLSSYVANAQIRIDGKGPIAGKQRQGVLSQILNFLF